MSYEIINCENEEEWKAERLKGIGGSEAAAVLGVSPWLTPAELWGLKLKVMDPTEDNERFAWGRRLEDDIVDAYVAETNRMVLPNANSYQISRSRELPFMQATLDAEIAPIDDRGPGVFEAKSAALFKQDEWEDGPPLQYLCQFQHTLQVKGYQWGSIAVVFGNYKFLWIDIERNDNFIEYLVKKEQAFWKLVEAGTPPPVDGSEGATELLKRLYPKPTPGQVVELPAEFLALDQEYQGIKEDIKKLEAREAEIRNLICAAIGGAEIGALASGDSYKWSHVKKEMPAKEAYTQSYRMLRRVAKKGTR